MDAGTGFMLLIGVFSGFVAGMAFWSFRNVFGLSEAPGKALASYLSGLSYGKITSRQARSAEIFAAAVLGGVYSVIYLSVASATSGVPVLSHTALTLAVLYGVLVPFAGAEIVTIFKNSPDFLEEYHEEKLNWGFLYFVYGSILGTVFHFTLYLIFI
ncbi:MAG: hypothetical protein ABEJ69_01465 [Candidatus Nanohaloarchaea archaeon]